ncbi:olfactory receptor 183-like isoform X2 [Heterocephalus glaber]|uniref:Olfactory receptor n=1 Tax=Heterocephalus glaber TaxID=10181 RepID=A0AAX6RCM9_HETGA|nr:olfactory receptor 183-like isoform X2 [Heterocephalus glaber]
MAMKNETWLTEFILTGLPHQTEWQILLFILFLGIYLITIVGNLGLITLIRNDSNFHILMYFFLGNLAFVDAWLSSIVTPKMLVNFLTMSKIPFSECMIQFFSFVISAITECFLLAAMAYDRYVAICKPLIYPVIMTNRLCSQLLVLSFVGGFLHALIHESFLFRLTFCNSNIIHHFYCDVLPLFKISCTDPSLNYLLVFIFSGSIQVFSIVTILLSYTFVLFTILKKKSEKSASKAFSTCGAHLFSVTLHYVPSFFMYVHPTSSEENDQEMISLFYAVIIPVINPFIYSLRNRQITDSLRKALKKNA